MIFLKVVPKFFEGFAAKHWDNPSFAFLRHRKRLIEERRPQFRKQRNDPCRFAVSLRLRARDP